jgi:hypothetical protein
LDPVAYTYSRLLVIDPHRLQHHLQQERAELELQLQLANLHNDDKEELPFIQMALAQLDVSMNRGWGDSY